MRRGSRDAPGHVVSSVVAAPSTGPADQQSSDDVAEQPAPTPWWRSAVFYEIYVRSFADGNGDGVGDLRGIRQRLPYLRDLGVDALWLTPFYPSPMADHGYDVADPREVDPLFGSLEEFDLLLAEAAELGLRVTVDIVPNHTSDRHAWFVEALAASPGSPARDRYLFRDGQGDGSEPPNNWVSTFGGSAWQRVPDGQYYLHLFAPEQPDLNWRHPEVVADAERTLSFWLDRGVDGFRIDVAHGLFKDEQLRDNPGPPSTGTFGVGAGEAHSWNQPEVHGIYRQWRRLLDSYPGDRMAVGEIWVADPEDVARYLRPDELHLGFNFHLAMAPWDGPAMRAALVASTAATSRVGAPATWVLSNHDIVRHVTRYGGGEVGLRRARAALMMLLALPGPVYLYAGEELGLPQVELPDDALQDPIWERSGHTDRGRDGCRVPLPWDGSQPPFGFSADAGGQPWLPMPADWAGYTVAAQTADPASMLEFYRRALALRRELPELSGSLEWTLEPAQEDELLSFRRGSVQCLVNLGTGDLPRPAGQVLLASFPGQHDGLPPDSAVWLRNRGESAL